MKYLLSLILFFCVIQLFAQEEEEAYRAQIGDSSVSFRNSNVKLKLVYKIQNYEKSSNDSPRDRNIHSPKSVIVDEIKSKYYVNALEGFKTIVYDLKTNKRLKVIKHKFTSQESNLFMEYSFVDYKFPDKFYDDSQNLDSVNVNVFSGKPVECCFTHGNKYLWVSYYRRSYDINSQYPSAVAIIDTEKDEIVRVMICGPLPKMLASSEKYVAVTNWGDNTVHLIDISSDDPMKFKYIKHFVIGKKMKLHYEGEEKVDRDSGCGFCLRGTVFTPDMNYLFVSRMGGGGIAVIDLEKMKYLKTMWGMQYNIRHLVINNNNLYLSANIPGIVQKTSLTDFIESIEKKKNRHKLWKSVGVGKGARTITVSKNDKYIFATSNRTNSVSVIDNSNMKVIAKIMVDSFPVGMALSENMKKLFVTTQGRHEIGGGHSVMVFDIIGAKL
jgi:YVTN family beta-propeller protein